MTILKPDFSVCECGNWFDFFLEEGYYSPRERSNIKVPITIIDEGVYGAKPAYPNDFLCDSVQMAYKDYLANKILLED